MSHIIKFKLFESEDNDFEKSREQYRKELSDAYVKIHGTQSGLFNKSDKKEPTDQEWEDHFDDINTKKNPSQTIQTALKFDDENEPTANIGFKDEEDEESYTEYDYMRGLQPYKDGEPVEIELLPKNANTTQNPNKIVGEFIKGASQKVETPVCKYCKRRWVTIDALKRGICDDDSNLGRYHVPTLEGDDDKSSHWKKCKYCKQGFSTKADGKLPNKCYSGYNPGTYHVPDDVPSKKCKYCGEEYDKSGDTEGYCQSKDNMGIYHVEALPSDLPKTEDICGYCGKTYNLKNNGSTERCYGASNTKFYHVPKKDIIKKKCRYCGEEYINNSVCKSAQNKGTYHVPLNEPTKTIGFQAPEKKMGWVKVGNTEVWKEVPPTPPDPRKEKIKQDLLDVFEKVGQKIDKRYYGDKDTIWFTSKGIEYHINICYDAPKERYYGRYDETTSYRFTKIDQIEEFLEWTKVRPPKPATVGYVKKRFTGF